MDYVYYYSLTSLNVSVVENSATGLCNKLCSWVLNVSQRPVHDGGIG